MTAKDIKKTTVYNNTYILCIICAFHVSACLGDIMYPTVGQVGGTTSGGGGVLCDPHTKYFLKVKFQAVQCTFLKYL